MQAPDIIRLGALKTMNVYLELTREFNRDRLLAVLCGGQAVVLHRLAIMSKDGDWILREDPETMERVLSVLGARGARYRFGAPLDVRWMSGGWSAHLEFHWQGLRVRTDFVTRPARVRPESLEGIWQEAEGQDVPFAGARDLADMKMTNREKDYAVIGELARRMREVDDQILYSRSARDLMSLAEQYPERWSSLSALRPALKCVGQGREALEAALDAERRLLIRANEMRLAGYMKAAKAWAEAWPELSKKMQGLALEEAHRLMVQHAEKLLPFLVEEGAP